MNKSIKIKAIIIFIISVFITGCGTILNGHIINKDTGLVLPMQIEMSYGTGMMSAFNPETGEKFEGQYTGIRSANRYDTANTKAILIGDKGTVLDVQMLIQPGVRPKGIGEAVSNKGERFQVQF